jgi:hypothetical protein
MSASAAEVVDDGDGREGRVGLHLAQNLAAVQVTKYASAKVACTFSGFDPDIRPWTRDRRRTSPVPSKPSPKQPHSQLKNEGKVMPEGRGRSAAWVKAPESP